MAIVSRRLTYRVTIGDQEFRTAPGIQINQSVDQLCKVADFAIATRPNELPDDSTPVLIEIVDVSGGRAYPIFGGKVNVRNVVAKPWSYQITAVDQLENFRRMRTTGDMNLTGMTDREAWMAIADACNVEYDPDDIFGTTYELGARVPVKWLKDNQTSGGQLITEMDELFGFKTMTIGDNRVIRIHLDQTPEDSDGLYKTYTKGVNVEFLTDTRVRGERDELQNAWKVTGVKEEISKSCTAQVWAKAEADSPYLASKKVRVGVQDYGSDMIQNEALAEYVVRRQMRLTNRLPDKFTVGILTDHNVHVGSKVRIVDTTKGIGASAGKYCMVRSSVINGFTQALELMPGPGGEEGTVTTGTEKICNKTSTDTDTPGGFDEPDFGYPPLTDGIDGDFDGDGDVDSEDGEDPLPSPIEGCTTDATFANCDESDADQCTDGSASTEDLSGTSPADFCVTYLNDYRLQTKSFSAGGVGFSTQCQVHVPWREVGGTGGAYYHLAGDGSVDYVQTINTETTVHLVANNETDPDDQTVATDVTFAAPLVNSISGTVEFYVPGSSLRIAFFSKDGGGNYTGDGAYMTIYAEPGLEVNPGGTDTDYIFGVELNGCSQGPILVGDALPNTSFGSLNRNNGGYVASTPAAVGVPVSFTLICDETRKFGWGWTFGNTSLGSGYLDHNDYLNQAHGPFPGEPSMPTNKCEDDHTDGHALVITMNPGGAGTEEAPGVRLYGVVIGHSTCTVNNDFGTPP